MEKDIKIKSNAIRDILDKPPAWLFRWGNSIFLMILILIFFLAFWMKFPQTANFSSKLFISIEDSTVYLRVPAQYWGAITKGQQLNINLVNFPVEEFGMMEAKVIQSDHNIGSDGLFNVTLVISAYPKAKDNSPLPLRGAFDVDVTYTKGSQRLIDKLLPSIARPLL